MKTNRLKGAACTILAAAIAGACTAFPSSAAENKTADSAALKYEFEDGATSGGKIYTEGWTDDDSDLTNFSGSGFAYLDQKGTTVSVEADVPEAGLYELKISYCEPSDPNKKVQYLNVNGVNQGELTFPYNNKFEEISGGVVMLAKGKNTIELKAYWGHAYYDYLTLKPASDKLENLSPTRQLSNPDASDSAKRLYSYLCDVYGKHIIAGQQEYCGEHNYNSWNDPDTFIKDNEEEFEYILKTTGKQPAIRGIDLLAYCTSTEWRDHAPERCIEWTNKYGGIATVTWHWNVPCEEGSDETAFYVESANPKFTTFSISNALKEGTWENEVLLADIGLIASELKKLKDADVPILWRPLHEAEGAWFWWGAEGAEPCVKLYRLLYDKLTNEYGLDNLIWVWTGSTSPAASEWYPGDDVVDIVGYDKYNAADGKANYSSIASTFYSLVQSTDGEKMVAMTENDTIPSLENLINDKASWLYFCPWYKNFLTAPENNSAENLTEIYNSEYCITLDELPDLKTYPISEGEPTTNAPSSPTESPKPTSAAPTEASTSTSKHAYGDVDLDGDITINDVITLICHVAHPSQNKLSEEAALNADVYENGSGLNVNDVCRIQSYLAGLIDDFNI